MLFWLAFNFVIFMTGCYWLAVEINMSARKKQLLKTINHQHKTTVYYMTSQPSPPTVRAGDMWFTDTGMHRADTNGGWVKVGGY